MHFMPDVLINNRIKLRAQTIDDAQMIYDYFLRNKKQIEEFGDEIFNSIDDTKKFLTNVAASVKQKYYLIYAGDVFVGILNIWNYARYDRGCELGYSLDSDHVGHGYMQSAIELATNELFKNGIVRIEVKTATENVRSVNLIKKCGFELEGGLRKKWLVAESHKYNDVAVFAKINAENVALNEKNS